MLVPAECKESSQIAPAVNGSQEPCCARSSLYVSYATNDRFACVESYLNSLAYAHENELPFVPSSRTKIVQLALLGTNVGRCGQTPMKGRDAKIVYDKEKRNPSFVNLMRCRSWMCPSCAPMRANDCLKTLKLIDKAATAQGYTVILITNTIQHRLSSSAERVLHVLKKVRMAVRKKELGRLFKKFGINDGVDVWGVEYPYKVKTGWHFHLHTAVYTKAKLSDEQIAQLKDEVADLWCRHARVGNGNEGARTSKQAQDVRLSKVGGAYIAQELVDGINSSKSNFEEGKYGLMDLADIARGEKTCAVVTPEKAVKLIKDLHCVTFGDSKMKNIKKAADFFGVVVEETEEVLTDGHVVLYEFKGEEGKRDVYLLNYLDLRSRVIDGVRLLLKAECSDDEITGWIENFLKNMRDGLFGHVPTEVCTARQRKVAAINDRAMKKAHYEELQKIELESLEIEVEKLSLEINEDAFRAGYLLIEEKILIAQMTFEEREAHDRAIREDKRFKDKYFHETVPQEGGLRIGV